MGRRSLVMRLPGGTPPGTSPQKETNEEMMSKVGQINKPELAPPEGSYRTARWDSGFKEKPSQSAYAISGCVRACSSLLSPPIRTMEPLYVTGVRSL